MPPLALTRTPVAKTAMLIRKPPMAVFEAFADPAITTHFWFTRSSGRLEAGREVRWDWEMFGVSASVRVTAVEPGRRIVVEWPRGDARTEVEWRFGDRGDGTTFVEVSERGFDGDGDARVAAALDSTEGFALVLCGLKAWLEHGLALDSVRDRFPPDNDASRQGDGP